MACHERLPMNHEQSLYGAHEQSLYGAHEQTLTPKLYISGLVTCVPMHARNSLATDLKSSQIRKAKSNGKAR